MDAVRKHTVRLLSLAIKHTLRAAFLFAILWFGVSVLAWVVRDINTYGF